MNRKSAPLSFVFGSLARGYALVGLGGGLQRNGCTGTSAQVKESGPACRPALIPDALRWRVPTRDRIIKSADGQLSSPFIHLPQIAALSDVLRPFVSTSLHTSD